MQGHRDGWTNCFGVGCHVHVIFYSIFQPAASELNSAFLHSVKDIGDHRQLGWLGAR